jgi:triosephosphate isomerase
VPFTDLETALEATKGTNIQIGAQNCHWAASGAFTAEISAGMLKEMGVPIVIIGHSERRQFFGETDGTVNQRVRAALDAGLTVILCVGELLEQREQGITAEICALQTKIALQGVSKEELKNIIIAYEPVWAIGTGKTATAAQANEVNRLLRDVVMRLYGEVAADGMTIQYGGSMNALNADELLAEEDVDGGLIGGASLKAADFAAIVRAASK